MTAVLKPRSAEVLLFQGDDIDSIEAATTALNAAIEAKGDLAVDKASGRLNDADPVKVAGDALQALLTECTERAVTVIVTAVGHGKFRELVAAHPPREGQELDDAYGFNYDEMGPDLVLLSLPEDMRGDFYRDLGPADFTKIYHAAIRRNQGQVVDPKDALFSRLGLTGAAN